jgi:hypothetical protein
MGDYNRRSDISTEKYDITNWKYILGLPPDFMSKEEEQSPNESSVNFVRKNVNLK